MIRTSLYRDSRLEQGGAELLEAWRNDGGFLWLDISGEPEDVERPLLESFTINPLAITDALRKRHPPKVELFDDVLFILLRGLDDETENVDFGTIQLSLFVGEGFLISRHNKASVSANRVYRMVGKQPDLMADGAGRLALTISGVLVRRYVQILLELEPRLDDIEDELFERANNDALLAELTGYKSRLRHIARFASYHEGVFKVLKRGSKFMPKSLEHELIDVYEQIERTYSLAHLYYEVARDLTDGYLGLTSHRLNRVMQILTVITVIFVPMTFLAGIYGMNFENMPELRTGSGYFVILSVMFVAAVAQLIVFRRKGWI